MYKVKVEIETIVPYKQDRFTEQAKVIVDDGTSTKGETLEQKKRRWEEKVYKDEKGCYIPVSQIYHSLINGLSAKPTMVSNKVKLNKTVTKATIFIEETKLYLFNGKIKKNYDDMDIFHVRTPLCGMQINAHPMFNPGYTAEFTITVVQDFLLPNVLKNGLIRAGQCYGIGAGRPVYGRFIVKKFEVEKFNPI